MRAPPPFCEVVNSRAEPRDAEALPLSVRPRYARAVDDNVRRERWQAQRACFIPCGGSIVHPGVDRPDGVAQGVWHHLDAPTRDSRDDSLGTGVAGDEATVLRGEWRQGGKAELGAKKWEKLNVPRRPRRPVPPIPNPAAVASRENRVSLCPPQMPSRARQPRAPPQASPDTGAPHARVDSRNPTDQPPSPAPTL